EAVKLIYEYNQLSIMIEKAKNNYLGRLGSDNDSNNLADFKELYEKAESYKANLIAYIYKSKLDFNVEFPQCEDITKMRSKLSELKMMHLIILKSFMELGEEAGTARANIPISAEIKLFYYETVIVHSSDCTKIGVGMCKDTNEMPGKCDQSSGYYGCGSFYYNRQKIDTLEGFTTGDIVGFGYNFVKNEYLLTKNGKKLKIKFTNLGLNIGPFIKKFQFIASNSYYPVIVIGSKDSEIIIKFDDLA
ncbi:25750_t:CDS:2, partial [Racocetra persica]